MTTVAGGFLPSYAGVDLERPLRAAFSLRSLSIKPIRINVLKRVSANMFLKCCFDRFWYEGTRHKRCGGDLPHPMRDPLAVRRVPCWGLTRGPRAGQRGPR